VACGSPILARSLLDSSEDSVSHGDQDMANVSYIVPPTYTAGKAGVPNKNPNDPNMLTTGAYGSAFELALNTTTDANGTTSDTLTYTNYQGKTNGTFSAVSESGTGGDLASAYQALLSSMQQNGEMNDANASQINDAFSGLEVKSQNGSNDATISGGGMLIQAGGPLHFDGISAYQNNLVDSVINELTSRLQHESIA
jgi:hypothetical protein